MEPGKQALERLTISLPSDDLKLALKLKHKLEASVHSQISMSELFRQGIKCLCVREGIK